VYVPVPPLTVDAADPLLDPQVADTDVAPTTIIVGCVILNTCDVLQLLTSDTLQVYVPTHRLLATFVVLGLPTHEYVIGADPPITLVVATPVHCEKHNGFDEVCVDDGPLDVVIVTV
jgi:hypothetical protein